MGITDTARAKARASVSQAQAEVADLTAQLAAARRAVDGSQAAGDVLDSVRDTPLVGQLTAGMRDKAGVDQAKAIADVDRLTAELSSAQGKLDLAKKAEAAILAVTGGEQRDDDED
jgi:hypothetical protein